MTDQEATFDVGEEVALTVRAFGMGRTAASTSATSTRTMRLFSR